MSTLIRAKQFLKFSIVGIVNTLITLLIIWTFVNVFSTTHYTANLVGYIAGVVNSFLLNKYWTFKDKSEWGILFVKFISVFAITYLIQLLALYLLINFSNIPPFLCQILAMGVYTVLNYLLNCKFTFNSKI